MTREDGIKIGEKKIGHGKAIYVIAEAGVNHNGGLAVAHRLIDVACGAGADAVKFQMFCAEQLVMADTPVCAYQQKNDPSTTDQLSMLQRLELKASAFVELQQHADEKGIDFLATPFGLSELEFLTETLHVPALKIASTDLVNVPLISAAIESRLPVIVSTGASLLEEIDLAMERFRRGGANDRVILLHCISSYPTPLEAVRLRCMATLRDRYHVPVGFSDHTDAIAMGRYAALAGAMVLEKHLTLDQGTAGPDHFFSLEPESFGEYVTGIRQAENLLGDGHIGYGPHEAEVRKRSRGSVVAVQNIAAGQRLTREVLSIRRPADGISPMYWEEIIGRVARIVIPSNTALRWSMLV